MRMWIRFAEEFGPCETDDEHQAIDAQVARLVMGWRLSNCGEWWVGPGADEADAKASGCLAWSPSRGWADLGCVVRQMTEVHRISVNFTVFPTRESRKHIGGSAWICPGGPPRLTMLDGVVHRVRMNAPTVELAVCGLAVWWFRQPEVQQWRDGAGGVSTGGAPA